MVADFEACYAVSRLSGDAMPKLDFGIFDTTEIPDDRSPAATAAALEEHLADAQLAERLGYGYFFFIEHQNAGFDCISASTVYLAALARATRTIRIGAQIFQLPLHHPMRLAQDLAMIDHLSHGRLEAAFGYGTRTREFEPWKISFKDRREIGTEVLEIALKAWTEREVTYRGKHWSVEKALPQPHPYQLPHPPVWIGAHSLASFDYAAKNNFGVSQIFEVEDAIAEKFAYFRKRWREHRHPGPEPRKALVRHVHVAETDKIAREEAEQYMLQGIQGPMGVVRAQNIKPEEATKEMLEMARVYYETSRSVEFWLDEGLGFVGSPATVAKAIAEQHRKVGYDILLLNRYIDLPHDLYVKSLRLFSAQVMPAFAAAAAK
jgi:alkanesulfonate monooxygenase SsuD/methylene tetrahydromethanopterin reductase-like flavin-dependent oxidoreductase (luciferase family)